MLICKRSYTFSTKNGAVYAGATTQSVYPNDSIPAAEPCDGDEHIRSPSRRIDIQVLRAIPQLFWIALQTLSDEFDSVDGLSN